MLSSGLNNFTVPAFLHATDNDATSPNNEVRYEIVHGNYDDKFRLDEITGIFHYFFNFNYSAFY